MPEPGDLIGPYRFVSQLGKGAMGEVWRARDERLDRYVAVKVLVPDLASDAEHRVRVLREARAAAAIRHANVVTLFDIVEHKQGDSDMLVMELVEGRTLNDVLRKSGAPELAVGLKWIAGIADALVAAHARGILHRDLKAANVMIANDGGVKVLDFGLAKLRDGTSPAPPTEPAPSPEMLELGATLAPVSYETQAGSLIGTPMYMSPEQVAGNVPDERSEIYSLGMLAYEILAGKPAFAATALDELFAQIKSAPPPPLAKVPPAVAAIVMRALAKDPAARYPSMVELRDAIASERDALAAPRIRRGPMIASAVIAVVALAVGAWWWRAHRVAPLGPGDEYVQHALEEYDVFYNEKALSSLRAALAVSPEHPRANAYMLLFGGASLADRQTALAAASRARPATSEHGKDRALLDAAIALVESGPVAARAALVASGATADRELAFWTAELDWRAGHYQAARDEYRALLAEPAEQFRGRIYDHDSSVLLYLDQPEEALAIGKLYRDAFPGEADAVGVYATTLAAAGKLDEAVAAAEDAMRLSEGEDTLAGLAKVLALRGDHARAKELYQRALDKAGPTRRPLRRAALAMLQWIDGDLDLARATVAPCLAGGADDAARERGACLFVAGVVDPANAEPIAAQLDELAAAATPTAPAYGSPHSLAALVRARAAFFGGGCVVTGTGFSDRSKLDEAVYALPVDFFAAYHVPFFATWQLCEFAAVLAAEGNRDLAAATLRGSPDHSASRPWIAKTLQRYE